LANWFDDDNVLGVDFKLFSSFKDAQEDENEWLFCNYNDPEIGFPRGCGPHKAVDTQWNSLTRGGKNDISYYVWYNNPGIGTWSPLEEEETELIEFSNDGKSGKDHEDIAFFPLLPEEFPFTFGDRPSYCVTSKDAGLWSEALYFEIGRGFTAKQCILAANAKTYNYAYFMEGDGHCRGLYECPFEYDCMEQKCLKSVSNQLRSFSVSSISESLKWFMVYGTGLFESYEQDSVLWKTHSDYTKQSGVWDDPTFYIRRLCMDCNTSHKDIIYKRLTNVPSDMDIENLFLANWFDDDNVLGVDFKLYSTFEDAQEDENEWLYCNYNDPEIGFPRGCGPQEEAVGDQWNSLTREGKNDISYYVWYKNPIIGHQR